MSPGKPEPRGVTAPRRRWLRILGALAGLGILAFMALECTRQWASMPRGEFQPDWWLLGATAGLFVATSALLALQWRGVVASLGEALSARDAVAIHFLAQLGKYLPGKFLLLVGKVVLTVRQGVSQQAATVSVAYEQLLVFTAGALTVLGGMAFAGGAQLQEYRLPVAIALAASVACLHPRVVRAVVGVATRVMPRFASLGQLSVTMCAFYLARYVFVWLLHGLVFYVLASVFIEVPLGYLPDLIAVAVLGNIVGGIAFFAPAGVGVREASVVLLLSGYFPEPISLAIALAYRAAVTAAEAVGVLSALGLRYAGGLRRESHE